jgi:hypothetical protein
MSRTFLKPLPPASEAVAPWVQKLRAAMFDAITETDIQEIVKNLVKRAKDGDPGAVKMLFDYVLGGRQASTQAATIETQNNLILPPPRPTRARPGSRQKVLAMAERAQKGLSLNHDDDAGFGGSDEE